MLWALLLVTAQLEAPASQLRLGFKHMSKCAGSEIAKLLDTAKIKFHAYGEKESVQEKNSKDMFVIASVRNPCSYLVSLWAFHGGRSWAEEQNLEAQLRGTPYWENVGKLYTHANPQHFQNWARETVDQSEKSVMSRRFFEGLVQKRNGLSCWGPNVLTCDSPDQHLPDREIEEGLLQFAERSRVDCWVYLESFQSDLANCLRMYETLSGNAINWEGLIKAMELTARPTNFARHGSCEDVFSGAEPGFVRQVLKSNEALSLAFGYSTRTCCGGPTNRTRLSNTLPLPKGQAAADEPALRRDAETRLSNALSLLEGQAEAANELDAERAFW